ncbi:amidohydrolase [Endozoicomonas elysicola]|uniref:Amidohydrolase n=1 Tax=Endozoicomonas elysicola TaxID=305900 RepID=A0A081KA00_9GAMM|nr:amidohydrolase [Endozoicomonas elysicola]KEI70976.1 amidohydrolase [Endozoicomonas elysicola]
MNIIKKITTLILYSLFLQSASASLATSIADDEQRLLGLFKHLHQNPEHAFMEVETAALVTKELKSHGFAVHTGIAKTGVVGILENGPGPVVMFRSDMDALPIKEETNLPYKSTAIKKDANGIELPVMHACGHDAHTVWLIGLAKQLAARKSEWSGTAVLVAQPAEEPILGATAMVNDGLYKVAPKPDIIISGHTMGVVPAGSVAIHDGRRMAGTDQMDVLIKGVGGHGSTPHAAKDPVIMAAMAIMGYQAVVSRSVDQSQPAVLTVGAIQAGDSNNIIPDSATLKVNLRWYTEADRDQMIKGIKSVTDNIARMYGIPNDRMPTYTMKGYSKPVINGKGDTQQARSAMQAALGENKVLRGMPPVMGSEDFHMLGSPYPDTRILYIEIGSGAKDVYSNFMEKGILPEVLNHNPRYVVEPEAIVTGTTALTSVVLSFLSK